MLGYIFVGSVVLLLIRHYKLQQEWQASPLGKAAKERKS